MIAVIWGSTSFHAYKLGSEGNVEAERTSARGAVAVPAGGFEEALKQEVGDWIHEGDGRVLLCGMVGARRGWKEAPYVTVPADFDRLVEGVVRVEAEGMDARIVPGMMAADENGVPEVLRGEETQIFGCAGEVEKFARVCLPGLHSKRVDRFADFRLRCRAIFSMRSEPARFCTPAQSTSRTTTMRF